MVAAFIPAPSPELVEIAAYAGFDFAVIDAEHGPISIGDVVHMVRAAQAANMPVLVRVPVATKDFVLRSLDAGADGILVPQVESAAEAAAIVEESHYPPLGRRGAAYYARAHRFTKDFGWPVLERANRNIVTGIMVETAAGVSSAAAISGVGGVDFVLMGSTDLSVTLGNGAGVEDQVSEAIKGLGQLARETGCAAGISATTAELGQKYAALGYQIVAVGLLPLLLKQASIFASAARPVATSHTAS